MQRRLHGKAHRQCMRKTTIALASYLYKYIPTHVHRHIRIWNILYNEEWKTYLSIKETSLNSTVSKNDELP